jgi:hypothetical protein
MIRRLLALIFSALACAAAHAATVQVVFVRPQVYSDVSFRETGPVVEMIEQELKELGERYLPPSYRLRVEVLDVDLAGRMQSFGQGPETRVMRGGSDWPSMRLRYVLEGDGRMLARGDEHIDDKDFLGRPQPASLSDYPYERRLLETWFRTRLAPLGKKPEAH